MAEVENQVRKRRRGHTKISAKHQVTIPVGAEVVLTADDRWRKVRRRARVI